MQIVGGGSVQTVNAVTEYGSFEGWDKYTPANQAYTGAFLINAQSGVHSAVMLSKPATGEYQVFLDEIVVCMSGTGGEVVIGTVDSGFTPATDSLAPMNGVTSTRLEWVRRGYRTNPNFDVGYMRRAFAYEPLVFRPPYPVIVNSSQGIAVIAVPQNRALNVEMKLRVLTP